MNYINKYIEIVMKMYEFFKYGLRIGEICCVD